MGKEKTRCEGKVHALQTKQPTGPTSSPQDFRPASCSCVTQTNTSDRPIESAPRPREAAARGHQVGAPRPGPVARARQSCDPSSVCLSRGSCPAGRPISLAPSRARRRPAAGCRGLHRYGRRISSTAPALSHAGNQIQRLILRPVYTGNHHPKTTGSAGPIARVSVARCSPRPDAKSSHPRHAQQ
jgi:hypothetical protein